MTTAERPVPQPVAGITDRPGYLVVRSGDGTAYLGALMVTDSTGLPVDFRYTDPIEPTRLQRALYGGVLDRYLRTEVVTRTLLGALAQPPTMLVVDDRQLLDEQVAPCPVVLLAASAAGALGPVGATHAQGGGSFLLQVAERENPVRVSMGEEAMPAHGDAVTEALLRLGATMDLLEPVDRVRDALDLVAAGEVDPAGS